MLGEKAITFSNKVLLFLVIILMFLSSCAHDFYTPPEANLLNLSEKGELKLSGGLGALEGDESRGSRPSSVLSAGRKQFWYENLVVSFLWCYFFC